MSEKAGTATKSKPSSRFANETPAEKLARGQRALKTLMRIRAEGGLQLDIDIDELRGRKRS